MGKYKEKPMYNIISLRVSDEVKSALEEISRYSGKSISDVVREAVRRYDPCLDGAAGRG